MFVIIHLCTLEYRNKYNITRCISSSIGICVNVKAVHIFVFKMFYTYSCGLSNFEQCEFNSEFLAVF